MKNTKDSKFNIFSGKTKVFAIIFICLILAAVCTGVLVNRHYQISSKSQTNSSSTSTNTSDSPNSTNDNQNQEETTYITNFDESFTLLAVQTLADTDGYIQTIFSQYLQDGKMNSAIKMTPQNFENAENLSKTILNIIEEDFTNAGVELTEQNIISDDALFSFIGNLSDILNASQK